MKLNKKMLSGIVVILLILTGNYVVMDTAKETPSEHQADNRASIEVQRVIDGDTIVFKEAGQEYKMRLLLIDTPESSTTKTGSVQPYGKEAKEFLINYLKGKTLTIEYEPTQKRIDKYGRVLAYLFADGTLVQEILVQEGLARVGYEEGQEVYLDQLLAAEQVAAREQLNIWSIKNYVGEYGFNEK
ncbi:thermonuclease family protein [Carnobacterium mobile]|uniref:thermonuclease family protein n=1 Tax=Carnobacterium mobile TaxID=2750 RepID=UPI000552EE53|nr:thermonuclease family protein [Carnobacterium mobile]